MEELGPPDAGRRDSPGALLTGRWKRYCGCTRDSRTWNPTISSGNSSGRCRVPRILKQITEAADLQDMTLFQWSEAYSVGYPAIDSQHKRLFQLAEQLHAAMTAGKGKQCLSTTLNNLIEYTKRHFSDEEILMESHRYPLYQQHKAEHQALTERGAQFQRSFAAGQATVTVELLQFLRNSLTHHIGTVDKKVGEFFRQQPH